MSKQLKIIISGGGTGGHIFPALSIANCLKQEYPDVDILFVGAEGKMEMEKVPAAGYPIVGLPVAGLQRRLTLKNLLLPFKVSKSLRKAGKILKDFKPDAVVGVGGYASAPVLWKASRKGIPTLIQEQNSYAGVTNKMLSKRAKSICVAYEGMERFFPKDKIHLTGNPIRQDLYNLTDLKSEAYQYFNLDPQKKTILLLGGSLGARTLNQSVLAGINALKNSDVQFIWQSGKYYFEQAKTALQATPAENVHLYDFVSRMDYAYAVADIVISRAGAGTISELCMVAKPCILVPSPNVSEDHQTANAMALVNKQAAVLVKDIEAIGVLVNKSLALIKNKEECKQLSENIAKLAKPDAAKQIVAEILKLVPEKE